MVQLQLTVSEMTLVTALNRSCITTTTKLVVLQRIPYVYIVVVRVAPFAHNAMVPTSANHPECAEIEGTFVLHFTLC